MALLLALLCAAHAQDPAPEVHLLTIGPGAHPFNRFGHTALWIHDPASRPVDAVYNWGTFGFDDPMLLPKFVLGRFDYWLSVDSLAAVQHHYRVEERGITVRDLALTDAQARALQALVVHNAQPENAVYAYDYYADNCATRPRDLLDRVTDGALQAVATDPGHTWRWHTLRSTQPVPWLTVALDLALADPVDKPTTLWEEAFLPAELDRIVDRATVVDGAGEPRPLVSRTWELVPTTRPALPERPRTTWPAFGLAGIAFGGLFAGAGAVGGTGGRRIFGLWLALWGVFAGTVGGILVFAWVATDHAIAWANENLWLCVPWGWALAVGAVPLVRGRPMPRWLLGLLGLTLGAGVLGLLLEPLPAFDQENHRIQAWFLPLWFGAFYGASRLRREKTAPPR